MNIDKEAHDRIIMEIANNFNLKECIMDAYDKAVIKYNGGGEARSSFSTGEIKLQKIVNVCPFSNDNATDSALNSIEWFQEVIKQYINSMGISMLAIRCEEIYNSTIFPNKRSLQLSDSVEFFATLRINT